MTDQFDVILMDKKLAFLSKTRTFVSDSKHLNSSGYLIFFIYQVVETSQG